MIQAQKNLGQHFLIDDSVINRIQDLIHPKANDLIVEIGPGTGALTRGIVNKPAQLHVIELDRHLATKLQNEFAFDNIQVHHCDAMNFAYENLFTKQLRLRIIGNLPYQISTQLILNLALLADHIHDMCFMVQKEVAERLTATCGASNYGRLTVSVTRLMSVEIAFHVAPHSFMPAPQVQSSVIYLRPRPDVRKLSPEILSEFSNVVRTAFGNRRKTIRNSLASIVDDSIICDAGIDPKQRAQNLSVDEYLSLAELITARKQSETLM